MTTTDIIKLIDDKVNGNYVHIKYFNDMIIQYQNIENKTPEQKQKLIRFKEKKEGYTIANSELNDVKLSITFYNEPTK